MVDWQGAAFPVLPEMRFFNHEKSPYNVTRKGLISYLVRLERFELPAYRFVGNSVHRVRKWKEIVYHGICRYKAGVRR